MLDGRLIEVNDPRIVFNGGAASFLTPDDELVEFACEDVRCIREAVTRSAP
jgi:hypothetical protein